VRADAAVDITASGIPSIRPGDSVCVYVSDPVDGLALDPMAGGAAVYGYVTVRPAGQVNKTGDALSGDPARFPVAGSQLHNGTTWYRVRMDSVFQDGAARTDPVANRFCVDLNDNLFTPGDTVQFVFAAQSAGTGLSTWWSEFTGTTDDMATALDNPMEFTCLPTGAGPFLYVDGFDGRGAQPTFDAALQQLGILQYTDRYDKRGPSSLAGNGIGGRVTDAAVQLADPYSFIMWNTGDLSVGPIGDGTGTPEKSNDAQVLTTFLDELPLVYYPTTSPRDFTTTAGAADTQTPPAGNGTAPGSPSVLRGDNFTARYGSRSRDAAIAREAAVARDAAIRRDAGNTRDAGIARDAAAEGVGTATLDTPPPYSGGVYFSGDDIADNLYNSYSPGPDLIALQGWIQGSVTNDSHVAYGFEVSPLVVAEVPSCFSETVPDSFIAYGGCPTLNDFDVLAPAGPAALEMSYRGMPGSAGAVISQVTTNSKGASAAVMLSGFSFHQIRQQGATGSLGPDYVEHLGDILYWMGWYIPTGAEPPRIDRGRNRLAQNYPNPFNPSTTITFELRDRAHVALRIYNVAGQLVRTLVDDVRDAGVTHTVEWDGRDAHGQAVSTGVYFYRIATRGFTSTRKMVLLK